MVDLDKIFMWLSLSDMPVKKLYDFALSFDNLQELWELKSYTNHAMKYLTGQEFQELISLRDGGSLDKLLNSIGNSKVKYVTLNDEKYPSVLRNLDVPPLVVYYIGNLDLLDTRCISIVGSRACTRYGVEQTQHFAYELSKAGFTIVSGLAEGIDGNAHTGALRAKGKAIGVLAGGLNYIYPAINVQLARDVVNTGGLILSEKAPDVNPKNFTFVQRNRLIAAIGEGVLVTEAGENSGALHTVNFALDMGKDIFAIPGNINSRASVGTNDLIKQFYSCCVTSPTDIIETLNNNYVEKHCQQTLDLKVDKKLTLKPEEQAIIDVLKNEEQHFDEILEKTKIDAKKLFGLLTTLEIRGLIEKLPSNFYKLKD